MTETRETTADADGGVRLSAREWCAAGAIVAAVLAVLPPLWRRAETFAPADDYRLPYALSEDYWLFDRWARAAAGRGDVAVVGDSVVWGHYVRPAEALSARLSEGAGPVRLANLGVEGTHPAALEGLLRHHGGGLEGRRVLLHLNPLWLASPDHDLSGPAGGAAINHPRLLPQFRGLVPGHGAPIERRLSVCVDRALPFRRLARHVQAACLGEGGAPLDLPRWTLRHPRASPLAALARPLPAPADAPAPSGVRPARPAGEAPSVDLPWVSPGRSVQWASFRRTVALLRSRGGEVFVLLGPLNAHALVPSSRERFDAVRAQMADWLTGAGVAFHAPPPLPAAEYVDLSHPTAAGYSRLAEGLTACPAFRAFLPPAATRPGQPPATAPTTAPAPRIVFCSNRTGDWRVHVMRPDGSKVRQLAPGPRGADDVDPVISPDGRAILFTSTRGGGRGVWWMPAGGGRPRRICDGDQAEWAPDGRRIVLRRGGRIVVRDLAGGAQRVVSPAEWTTCSGPAWSRDGKTIAFARLEGRRNVIYTVPAAGGGPTKLAAEAGACEPHFSPDGQWIVYETETHVAVVRPNGRDGRLITWFGGVQRYPRFGPDGRRVVFCQAPAPRGPWEIYVVGLQGGGPERLTEGASDMHPHWK